MNSIYDRPKYEDWFKCLLVIEPKIMIAHAPENEGDAPSLHDSRDLGKTDRLLRYIFFPLYLNFSTIDLTKLGTLNQALEFWVEERDEVIIEMKESGWDSMDTPAAFNIAKEILYCDRSIKIAIDKYLEVADSITRNDRKVIFRIADISDTAKNWQPHFGMDVLARFMERLEPKVSDDYVRACFTKGKKPAKSKKKGGRPKGMSQKTRQRYNWIRDKYHILKKKRSASTLDEMAGLIYSIMQENPPPFFEKTPYKKSTILKILKNKSWGAE